MILLVFTRQKTTIAVASASLLWTAKETAAVLLNLTLVESVMEQQFLHRNVEDRRHRRRRLLGLRRHLLRLMPVLLLHHLVVQLLLYLEIRNRLLLHHRHHYNVLKLWMTLSQLRPRQ